MNRLLTASTLALSLALAAPATASDLTALSDSERDAFRDEVRAYLLENPEVLMEAIAVLEERQAAAQEENDVALIATNAKDIFNDGYSHVTGNPEGDVTVVEFIDYRCGYCRKAFPELQSLIAADGNIKVIYKEFPILGEQSTLAARFALATQIALGEAAYGKLHDAIMGMRGNITLESLGALADSLSLNTSAILAALSDPKIDQIIGANYSLAQRLQISGTPSFVIENEMLRGYLPAADLAEIVERIRAEK